MNIENPVRLDQDSAAFVQTLAATGGGQINAVLDGDQHNFIYRNSPPYRVTPFTVPGATPTGLPRVPSRLLIARHQVVPFMARPELEQLQEWRDSAPGLLVRLVYAEGGQGKTRLAAEFAARSARADWTVAMARHRSEVASAGEGDEHLTVRPPGLVLLVDYAERWPLDDLIGLIRQHRDAARVRLRILLLARPAGSWWQGLTGKLARLGITGTDAIAMRGLPEGSDARAGMYAAARDRFAEIFGVSGPSAIAHPDLGHPVFALTLTVHMRALVDVDAASRGEAAPTGSGQADLSSYLLGRERDYWNSSHDDGRGPVRATETTMGRAVYVATLTRPLPRAQAAEALGRAQAADSPRACQDLLDDHARCYPPADRTLPLEPLYPDRLGEDFLALTLPGREDQFGYYATDMWTVTAPTRLLAPAGTNADAVPGTRQAMATLIQAATRWPHVTQLHLLPLLTTHPQLALAAGGTALAALVTLPGITPATLEAIEAHLPGHRHVDLDTGIAALAQRLAAHRLPTTSEPAERARINNNLAMALYRAGLYQQALAPAFEAVMQYLRLGRTDGLAHAQALGISAGNLSTVLSELGQREDALLHSEMAVQVMRIRSDTAEKLRRLSPGDRPAGEGEEAGLARALGSFGIHLEKAGRKEEALTALQEAVAIWRRLAAHDATASEQDLAMSVHNLGLILAGLGREEEALAAVEEAVVIDRRLAAANPAALEPELATSLSSLAARLVMLGRSAESVTAYQEAVPIQRRLAAANPAAFEPGLRSSLNGLAMALPTEAREEAVSLLEEVVRIGWRLAAANPAEYESKLAGSLTELGLLLSRTGRRRDALAPTREAMSIYQRLAKAEAAVFEPSLAKSSQIFAITRAFYATAEELQASDEKLRAAGLDPRAGNPPSPGLALALQGEEPPLAAAELLDALVAIRDSTMIFQRLAETLPDAYRPQLRISLEIAVHVLRSLARTEDADELNRLIEAGQVDQAADLLRETVRDEASLIYLVRGTDEGRPAWHFVKVDRSKLASFKQALSTRSLDTSEYGEILHSGWGEDPPEEARQELAEKYGE